MNASETNPWIPPGFRQLAELALESGLVEIRTLLSLGQLSASRWHTDGRTEIVKPEEWGREHGGVFSELLSDLEHFRFPDLYPARKPSMLVIRVETNEPSPKRKNAGGNPGKHDWEGALAHLAKIILLEEDEIDRAKMNDRVREWFIEATGDHPSDSQIREKVKRFHETIWPPKT